MRIAIILVCVGSVANAYRAHDLVSDVRLSETSVHRMQQKMARLNNIQKQIFFGRSATPEDDSASEIQFDQEFDGKPDELPYLFEGDILLTDNQIDYLIVNAEDQLWASTGRTNQRRKRSLTSDLSARWKMPISYHINTQSGVDERAVLAGINKWQEETCVTFKRMSSPKYSGPGLNFFLGGGCYSHLGNSQNEPQPLSIGYGCTGLGTVTHEIAHALGSAHEQSRYDRDNHIQFYYENVNPNQLSQFSKFKPSEMTDYGVGYDFGSVMHYGPESFSINRKETMVARDKNYQQTFGQRSGPSFSDVKRINMAYCNSSCTKQLGCLNGGYTDPKNCAKCRCPDGFGGTLCDRAADADPACGANELTATNDFQTISAGGAINCPYIITAPPGKKVHFELTQLPYTHIPICYLNYVEIKYKENVVPTGARFCNNYPEIRFSEGNRLVVIYKGTRYSRFSLQFRQDPVSNEKPATPRPTTTRRSLPTLRPTTTQPILLSTFFPVSSTAPSPMSCSAWTQCTSKCGGCGTKTRRCNGKLEILPCNTDPCEGGYCCRPFVYVKQGFCLRPVRDEQLIADARETSEKKQK